MPAAQPNQQAQSWSGLYPFAALAGQERMKTALLLLAVDPSIGGLLLIGQKGTAKSTAVRALMLLLPPLDVVDGCPFHCDPDDVSNLCPACASRLAAGRALPLAAHPAPFLTLPLGATEDRLVGGLDLEKAVASGRPALQVGLLGQANRGFLYLDEINLLEPYLAHLMLDAVECGRLRVEREGLSLWHPARVALIGTMNPEEGRLGPQLADRFALTVRVEAETDPALRAEIVRRRLAFEADPRGFSQKWSETSRALSTRITEARRRLARVSLSTEAEGLICELARDSRVRGHRADLALARTARALAAWQDHDTAETDHVRAIAGLALDGRRTVPKRRMVRVTAAQPGGRSEARHFETPYVTSHEPDFVPLDPGPDTPDTPLVTRLFRPNEEFELITPSSRREQGPRQRSGRRSARKSLGHRGRYYRSSPERLGRPLALDATVRAAAPHQADRRDPRHSGWIIRPGDFREKVFRRKTGRLVIFVVDASGSVGSLDRMSEAKAAVLALLADAYQKRDRVGLIAFYGAGSEVLLPPTNSVEMAGRLLEDLPTGGKTPLSAALVSVHRLLKTELSRDPNLTPLVVLMTDGRPNVALENGADPWRESLDLATRLGQDRRLRFLLVDTDHGHYADYKLTHDLAENLGAPRLTLEDLRRGDLETWLERMA